MLEKECIKICLKISHLFFPRCPFTAGSKTNFLLHDGLQHNVVLDLLKEDSSTLMDDMDFIVMQRNGLGEE